MSSEQFFKQPENNKKAAWNFQAAFNFNYIKQLPQNFRKGIGDIVDVFAI